MAGMSMSPGSACGTRLPSYSAWISSVQACHGTSGGAVSTSSARAAAFIVAFIARSAWYTRFSSSALAWMCTSFWCVRGACSSV